MNKTKIVCTIGPRSCNTNTLKRLIANGMSIARLNGSHNTLEWHRRTIKLIRTIDENIPILLDIPGRKIRTKKSDEGFRFSRGQELTITPGKNHATRNKVGITYGHLHRDLKAGDTILADDGTLKFRVQSIEGRDVVCRTMTKGVLKGGKGLNIPFVKVNTPIVTKRDREVIDFAIKNRVDWVGVSFVESAVHVAKIRRLLGKNNIGIISKIENQYAIDNLDEIIEQSSGLMVDRGDLGAETCIEGIGMAQKDILSRAKEHGKPVIVATEMLHSMIRNPQPTKAEIVDISNSILDGASAIMLSGETAVGDYPVAAVKTMRAVADEVEKNDSVYNKTNMSLNHASIPNAIGKSICEICQAMPIDKVVCITLSGYAANMISRYRIKPPILAVTNSREKARLFDLLWGVEGISLETPFYSDKYDHIIHVAEMLWKRGTLLDSQTVIFTAVIFPRKGNKMNFLAIHKIGNLRAVFNWEKTERRIAQYA
ncbi:MAG: pyruvate kinase [Planctomycetota bacterium]|nr:pyruvate kinase [Planctomycetota bacterium]